MTYVIQLTFALIMFLGSLSICYMAPVLPQIIVGCNSIEVFIS